MVIISFYRMLGGKDEQDTMRTLAAEGRHFRPGSSVGAPIKLSGFCLYTAISTCSGSQANENTGSQHNSRAARHIWCLVFD